MRTVVFLCSFVCLLLSSLSIAKPSRTPQRIVSASLASDEVLVELLKEKVDRQRLIAVSHLADNPVYSSVGHQLNGVTGRFRSDIESTLKMKPDLLILASFNQAKFKSFFSRFKIPFIELRSFQSLSDIATNIQLIGKAIGKDKEARKLSDKFLSAVSSYSTKLKKKCPRPVSALMFTSSNLLVGKDTTIDSILEKLDVTNSAAKAGVEGWAQVSAESIAKLDPDWIILSGTNAAKNVAKASGWQWLRAVKGRKFIYVPTRLLSSTSHHLATTVKLIAEQVCNGLKL